MPLDLRNIHLVPRSIRRPIDPIEIFKSSRINDPSINDLWLAQGDALRQWHQNRNTSDIAIVLNTGAGKTLVGLLIAQSLVNETCGKVLYVCSSNQLIEQTLEKAEGYGLLVTTYYEGKFNNDLYIRGEAPCLTNYQALFNGLSRFFDEDIVAIIFDDAHVAEHILRDQFTLTIERSHFPETYNEIFALFRAYFSLIGKDVSYHETQSGQDKDTLWLVPPFEVRRALNELQRILLGAKLDTHQSTKFAWAHLRDHLMICAIILSASKILITPPFIPVRLLRYFQDGIRRVFLTATLPPADSFLRTFGTKPKLIIKPETKAGECERLIIIPSANRKIDDDISVAKNIISGHKALILTTSYQRRDELWKDIMTMSPNNNNATETIRNFRDAETKEILVLVQRYDGIDLPGDTCRLMVIDGLPSGLNLYEKYLMDHLGLNIQYRSTVASRIVQSFGRISRGMSDHGVVIITGEPLKNWLLTPINQSYLPQFLQKQLSLGFQLSEAIEPGEFQDLVQYCLSRNGDWIEKYENHMQDDNEENNILILDDTPDPTVIALTEVEVGQFLWERDYEKAASKLEKTLDDVFAISQKSGAWHALWLGYCYELLGSLDRAQHYYTRARGASLNIPPCDRNDLLVTNDEVSPQIKEVVRYLSDALTTKKDILNRFDYETLHLDGTGTSAQHEEAIRSLGQYLGLNSTRPEKEYGTGPDVLWDCEGGPALCMEVKTKKTKSETYTKAKDIGQMHDHLMWCKNNKIMQPIPCFVGPSIPASPEANPPENTIVINLEELNKLSKRLRSALADILAVSTYPELVSITKKIFTERNLLWPDLLQGMKTEKLVDIGKQR